MSATCIAEAAAGRNNRGHEHRYPNRAIRNLGLGEPPGRGVNCIRRPVAECQKITSTEIETAQCLQDTLTTANAVLDSAFASAQAAADELDSVTGRPVARQALERSQSARSDFRNVNCLVPAAMAVVPLDRATSHLAARSRWPATGRTSFKRWPIAKRAPERSIRPRGTKSLLRPNAA